MDGKFPEDMKCPVCFEIPEREIFQCRKGHTHCNVCSERLTFCPMCRVPLDSPKIRSRALENLLDMMKFDCINKPQGCPYKVARNEISSHANECSFGTLNIGLCKLLGYQCGYMFSPKALSEGRAHFKTTHQFLVCSEPNINISVEGIRDFYTHVTSCWTPVILDLQTERAFTWILINQFNEQDNTLSPICIQISDDRNDSSGENFRAEFVVKAANASKNPDIVWSTPPIPLKQATSVLREPPFRLPLSVLLSSYINDGSLFLCCSAQISSANTEKPTPDTVSTFNISSSVASSTKSSIEATGNVTLPFPTNIYLPSSSSSGFIPSQELESLPYRVPLTTVALVEHTSDLGEVVFTKTICDVCRMIPVIAKYKCLQCHDYDLCGICFKKDEHNHHVFAMIQNKKQDALLRQILLKSQQWKPFFACSTLTFVNETKMVNFLSSSKCSGCRKISKWVCMQCKKLVCYCDDCFLRLSNSHMQDHFFAAVNTTTKLMFVLESLPKRK